MKLIKLLNQHSKALKLKGNKMGHNINNKELPLLISFSGGRTSAFMTAYLINRYPEREKHIVFANTGKERNETLDFIHECDKRWGFNTVWLESTVFQSERKGTSFKIVDYNTANRDGKPFEDMIRKYGIPNKMFPHCTRELKLRPITKYMQSIGYNKYESAIGIRADEVHRINHLTMDKERKIYPLAHELKVDKNFILSWWERQDFNLQLKDYEGNCDLCWKKSERKLMTIIRENPHLIEWWQNMELKYGGGAFITFYRMNKSSYDLIEASKKPFKMANDKLPILDMFGIDEEYACLCKST